NDVEKQKKKESKTVVEEIVESAITKEPKRGFFCVRKEIVMKERILNDLKEAMKQKDKELLSVIRMVKGAIQMDEIAKKRELNDDEAIAIISKQIKTRKESIAEFEK